jgi:hypothetical protein
MPLATATPVGYVEDGLTRNWHCWAIVNCFGIVTWLLPGRQAILEWVHLLLSNRIFISVGSLFNLVLGSFFGHCSTSYIF